MKSADPILKRWNEIFRQQPARPAIFDARGQVSRTFSAIQTEAEEWAIQLNAVPRGATVAIQVGNHCSWPALLLACLARELPVMPLETSVTDRERHNALRITKAAVLFTLSNQGAVTTTPVTKDAAADDSSGEASGHSLLKLTSGTTAAPRTIRFCSEQLLADCDQICDSMGISDSDLNYGVIPVSHSYGFSNLLTPLLTRAVPLVMTSDRLPRAVLNGLIETKATVFAGMPVFYQSFCSVDEPPMFKTLRLCISAGAPLPASLNREFHEKFDQPIHSFYGSSECGGICYDQAGDQFVDGFVGTPMSGVEIRMLEKDASFSQIEVRSAAVAEGYFPEPDTAKLGGGIFRPDDLLARFEKGFRIVGRISDIINVAGKKVNPVEVEALLASIKGVRQAVVFGRPSSARNEEVIACVVAEKDVDENRLLRACREHLNGWQVPRRIFFVPEIPVNERGKTSRRLLAERFAG